MTIEDAIKELLKYPPHYEIKALLSCAETGDQTAEFISISNNPFEKIVSFELATRLISETYEGKNDNHPHNLSNSR